MQFDTTQLIPVLPEISLLTLACVVLVVDLFIREEHRIVSYGIAHRSGIGHRTSAPSIG